MQNIDKDMFNENTIHEQKLEYEIVSAETFDLGRTLLYLTDEVNSKIKKGWKPQGGVVITNTTNSSRILACQAMIRISTKN